MADGDFLEDEPGGRLGEFGCWIWGLVDSPARYPAGNSPAPSLGSVYVGGRHAGTAETAATRAAKTSVVETMVAASEVVGEIWLRMGGGAESVVLSSRASLPQYVKGNPRDETDKKTKSSTEARQAKAGGARCVWWSGMKPPGWARPYILLPRLLTARAGLVGVLQG